MSQKSIGLIEAIGLCAGVTAADAAVKSANVKLIGYEYSKGDGMTTIKVEGDVGAVKAAVAAGAKAAEPLGGVKSVDVIARPADGILPTLIHNKENVGGEYHLKTGIRPKGQSAGPVLVNKSKAEAPKKAPVETPVETPVEEVKEEAPVEVKAEEPVVNEAEHVEATEAPVKEDTVETVPVEEKSEPVAEVQEEVTEVKEESTSDEEKKADEEPKVVKNTSRGKKGGKKSKNNSPKKDNE